MDANEPPTKRRKKRDKFGRRQGSDARSKEGRLRAARQVAQSAARTRGAPTPVHAPMRGVVTNSSLALAPAADKQAQARIGKYRDHRDHTGRES